MQKQAILQKEAICNNTKEHEHQDIRGNYLGFNTL